MSARVFAGIGLRRGCPAQEIVALVRRAGEQAGRTVAALAAPNFKRDEAGLSQAAAELCLALLLIGPEALKAAQPGCVTRSSAALAAVGVASVAEGSALAAAGVGARLLLPRIASVAATCALAEAP